MASKRAERRRACDGKKRYATEAEAQPAVTSLWIQYQERTSAYHCRFCGGYHVGHLPGKVRQAMDRRKA